jgi:hypothetical protein
MIQPVNFIGAIGYKLLSQRPHFIAYQYSRQILAELIGQMPPDA